MKMGYKQVCLPGLLRDACLGILPETDFLFREIMNTRSFRILYFLSPAQKLFALRRAGTFLAVKRTLKLSCAVIRTLHIS